MDKAYMSQDVAWPESVSCTKFLIPETIGRKDDKEKLPMELLPGPALEQIAEVLAFGARKYSRWNWRDGIAWSRVLGASLRHIHAFNDGEDLDPETGLSHLAHAGCCIAFLLTYIKEHPELDDRYVKKDSREQASDRSKLEARERRSGIDSQDKQAEFVREQNRNLGAIGAGVCGEMRDETPFLRGEGVYPNQGKGSGGRD